MEDDNKYACNACGTRQDAVRSIELDRLPPVLNVQLLRFVFDRKLGRKKKLLTFIEFGETLDMSKYLNQKPGTRSTSSFIIFLSPSTILRNYLLISDTSYRNNNLQSYCRPHSSRSECFQWSLHRSHQNHAFRAVVPIQRRAHRETIRQETIGC